VAAYWPEIFISQQLMKVAFTRSQDRILQLLKQLQKTLSAQDIYVELRNRGQSVGLATVYRALEALKLAGAVHVRTLASGESLYGSIQADRHHLTCLHCQLSIPIDDCPVRQLEADFQTAHQFRVYYHTLEFFGVCSSCAIAHPPAEHLSHSHDC
jgi:Fur family transcriptional regulator, ferric uptake regulator